MTQRAVSTVVDGRVGALDRRWLKRFAPPSQAPRIPLLCFHHAGGHAGMFRAWPRLMTPAVEPIAVQLPGRADRFREAPFERMAPLVDELTDVIAPLLEGPYACYWSVETSVRFELDLVPGGHFFGADGELRVIRAIGSDLVSARRNEAFDDD
jgi:surfactin synthase thioesterase subunit